MKREQTRQIHVGNIPVGGGAPVSVQSMCNTKTQDAEATLAQMRTLAAAGCDIIRVAVPNEDAARALKDIMAQAPMPVVTDIHFDYRLALLAAEAGVSAVRINPGNIGSAEKVAAVAHACKERNIPIRVGVNSGSVEKGVLAKYGGPTAEALVESAALELEALARADFQDVALSVKASDVPTAVAAYRLAAERFDCPLHVGVTEAGTSYGGLVNSAVGIGTLLMEGIGDTIRVSLTADPAEEVRAGLAILRACGLRKGGVRFVSCPTCGRTQIDLISLARAAEERLSGLESSITVAVMGCEVNGPGEAREADFGIAGGKGFGSLFRKGQVVETKIPEAQLLDRLMALIEREGGNT
ncbi:MAG: flavodoxin-dependent (E)-4-hydroxy-3-methylbut-2-enyl-diphosphate synthase [Oscillospiraceae bacterium]|nr:flavodoxin-dependent (E)-4-hydroxy-3-methylbut-2-enyl-diphosphate synthase [Oscillospiraceae bacterium]